MVSAVRLTGSVAELHARDPFVGGPLVAPEVWWCDFTDSAIVLGSSQPDELLDADAVTAAGLHVVRRRSGGGAVLLRPGAVVWIDLIVPAAAWPTDVRRSMVAAGEVWQAALTEVAAVAPGTVVVHDGGMLPTDWSRAVCFAGIGPGEVLAADATPTRKLVGLSQRRTRGGARIQGLVHRSDLVAATAALIAGAHRPGGVPPGAASADVDAAMLADAIASAAQRHHPGITPV